MNKPLILYFQDTMPPFKHNHQQRPRPVRQVFKRHMLPYNQAKASACEQIFIHQQKQGEIDRYAERSTATEENHVEIQTGNLDGIMNQTMPIVLVCVRSVLRQPELPNHNAPPWFRRFQNIDNSSVYDDVHNSHASSVTKSVIKSIKNLRKDPEPDFNSITDRVTNSRLSEETKQILLRFCLDPTVHMQTDMTFAQLLAFVLQRIESCDGEMRCELESNLSERMHDCINQYGDDVCFPGRFNRLLSTLCGFFKGIVITISDNERITAIFLHACKGIEPYDLTKHRTAAIAKLEEAGLTADQFKPWIDAIDEMIRDAEVDTDTDSVDTDTDSEAMPDLEQVL